MNNKLIVVGSMAVIALTAGLSYFNTTKDINSVYQPKEYGKSETRSNPEKVFEYINSLRANPQTGVVDFNEYQKVKGEVMKLAERKKKGAGKVITFVSALWGGVGSPLGATLERL